MWTSDAGVSGDLSLVTGSATVGESGTVDIGSGSSDFDHVWNYFYYNCMSEME